MLVNVEIYLDPTKPDEPIKQTVNLDPNGTVMVRSNRGSDYARFPDAPNDTLVVRFFPAPQKGPPAPPDPGPLALTSLNPSSILMSGGTQTIVLTGTGFNATTTCFMNGISTPCVVNSATQISMSATPQSAGTYKVKVFRMPDAMPSNELDLIVT